MPSEDLIKTVSKLPWDGLAKVLIFAGFVGFGYGEYQEDGENAGSDTLQRDLLVFTLSAVESLKSDINEQETRQNADIRELQEEMNDL